MGKKLASEQAEPGRSLSEVSMVRLLSKERQRTGERCSPGGKRPPDMPWLDIDI
jgi:hypothetical protein